MNTVSIKPLNRFFALLLLTVSSCVCAQSSQPLVIALDSDLSAVAVEGGIAIQRGLEIAIDEINEQGGLLGHQLVLESMDHRGNPARGINNIKQLADRDDVLAVVGGVHTPVALAELETIHQQNILYLGPWAAGTALVSNGYSPNNVFRVSIRDAQAGPVLIKAAKQRSIQRVALVLERTGWGRSNFESLTKAARQQQLDIVQTQWINWRQNDFSNEMQAIMSADVEAIILVANAPEAVTISKALLNSPHPETPIFSHWGLAGGDFVENLGLENLNKLDISVIQTFSFLQQTHAEANNLLTQYRQKFGDAAPEAIPAVVGLAHSYDLIQLLAAAVQQANSTDVAKVRQALENLPPLQGAVKRYEHAFSEQMHDALMAEDYFMTTFSKDGYLVPVSVKSAN